MSEEIGVMVVEAELLADDRAAVTCDVFLRPEKRLRPNVMYAKVEKFDVRREVALNFLERRALEEDQQAVKGSESFWTP